MRRRVELVWETTMVLLSAEMPIRVGEAAIGSALNVRAGGTVLHDPVFASTVVVPNSLYLGEPFRNLDHVAMHADRGHFQHIGNHELRRAVLGVLVEQLVQDLPRVGAELVKEVGAFGA